MIIKKVIKPISKYGIANVDLTGFAKLREPNTFTKENTFTNFVYFNDNVFIQGGLIYKSLPISIQNASNENQVVNVFFNWDNNDFEITLDPNIYTKNNQLVNTQDNSLAIWKNVKDLVSPISNNLETINGEIETLTNDIEDLGNQVNENTNQLQTLNNELTTQIERINVEQTTQNNNISTNTNSITTINQTLTNCAKLNVSNSYVGNSNANFHLEDTVTDYFIRFQCDKFDRNKTIDILRVHRAGAKGGMKLYLQNGNYNYLEYYGKTLISNMMDPTDAAHGANKRYVDNQVSTLNTQISNLSTQLTNKIKQATLSSRDYFAPAERYSVNNQRYRIYRVDLTNTDITSQNCLSINYETTDDILITFSYKWEDSKHILLYFCRINSTDEIQAVGNLNINYLGA